MTFEEAIDTAVKKYWQGKTPDKLHGINKFKYNKKYFDRFEETEFGSKLDWLNLGKDK